MEIVTWKYEEKYGGNFPPPCKKSAKLSEENPQFPYCKKSAKTLLRPQSSQRSPEVVGAIPPNHTLLMKDLCMLNGFKG